MARIRSIKPEFFTSLTVASLPVEARLTFIGLWTHVDDEGRCVDDARLIKAAVWPLDDRTAADVERDLQALTESSLTTRYIVNGRSYLAVNGWSEHQRINRPTESRLPAPSEGEPRPPEPLKRTVTSQNDTLPEGSDTPHAQLTEDSSPERNREQGTGNREGASPGEREPGGGDATEARDEPPPATDTNGARRLQAVPDPRPTPSTDPRRKWSDPAIDADPLFAAFWEAYPYKVSKGHARKSWLGALRKGADPLRIAQAARAFRDDHRRDPKFTPHPATWLNGERWNDVPAEPAQATTARPFWEN